MNRSTHPPIWWTGAVAPVDSDGADALSGTVWDLVVVGGGIVGLCAAISAAESGRRVCLIERGQVGLGTSSRATVKVTSGHGGLLADIAERHGLEAAMAYLCMNDDGFSYLQRLVQATGEDVGWRETPHVVHASEPTSVSRLRESVLVAESAGVDVSPSAPPPWTDGEAWQWGASALVQPVSLVRALARHAMRLGVRLVQDCQVSTVHDVDDGVAVQVRGADDVRAERVLIATQSPVHDPDAHTFRASYIRHWALVVPDDREMPDATYDLDPDGLSTRAIVLPDGRPGRVVVGLSSRVGESNGDNPYDHLLAMARAAGFTGHPMARWAAHDVRSPDLLPYVGPTRRDPRVLMATGLNGWGFTNAAGIALDLPRMLSEEAPRNEGESVWGARRLFPRGGVRAALGITSWVASSELQDTIGAALPHDLPGVGEGIVTGGPLNPRAVCRTSDGQLHSVSARCTHAGCLVRWNRWDEHWECPCHGSRFDVDGAVLQGPANRPLESHPAEGPEDGYLP